MVQQIKGRFFIVGCPRSGTTLLQSLIIAHSQIASFPESKFFQKVVRPNSIYDKFNLAPRKARRGFNQFLQDIDRQDLAKLLPANAISIPQYTESFIKVLDLVTLEQHKSFWLEKTPEHLRRINAIEKLVHKTKFIHIIRNGIDVITSLYEMTQKYPEVWGQPRKLERYINRWEEDIIISSHHLHKPNHFLVRYENLVHNPLAVLLDICQFFDVPFEKTMLQRRTDVASSIIRQREVWKDSVNGNLQKPDFSKFEQVFDNNQKKYILERLQKNQLDLDNLISNNHKHLRTDSSCRL